MLLFSIDNIGANEIIVDLFFPINKKQRRIRIPISILALKYHLGGINNHFAGFILTFNTQTSPSKH